MNGERASVSVRGFHRLSADRGARRQRFDDEDDHGEENAADGVLDLAEIMTEETYAARIEPLLDRLPEREADYLELYYREKKRQADIAKIFGVTQAAVSYRLQRAIERLKFLLEVPQFTEDELRADLPEVFPLQLDVDILVGMAATTCQSVVADQLGLTQGRVRHRFFKAVKILSNVSKTNPKFVPHHQLFAAIANKGFNALREVVLPQWQQRELGDTVG